MARLLSLLAIALACFGCTPEVPEGRFACEADDDCPPGFVCTARDRRCRLPPDAAADE